MSREPPGWNTELLVASNEESEIHCDYSKQSQGGTIVKRLIVFGLISAALCMGTAASAVAQEVLKEKKKSSSWSSSSTTSSKKGWLGVSIQDITPDIEKAMGLKSGHRGALVNDVTKKSPADSAGINEKDIVIQFGSESIADASDLQKVVADTKPGTKVAVDVIRKGEKKTVNVVVGSQKENRNMVFVTPKVGRAFEVFAGAQHTQGMSLRQLNEQLAKYFDVAEGNGVLVWEVEKGSPAEKAGINAGDVITVIGKKKIKDLRDVSRALGIFDDGEKADIELMRKGARKSVSLEIEDNNEGGESGFWFNRAPFKGHGENMLFDIPELEFHMQEMAVDPDLGHLKIELKDLQDRLKDKTIYLRENSDRIREKSRELREKIENDVKSRVKVHVDHTI
jgi:membrane-associated protease RseP (regulator of RpoE activity)